MSARGRALLLFMVLFWHWGLSDSPATALASPASPCSPARGDIVLLSLHYRQHILAKIVLPPWLPADLLSADPSPNDEPFRRLEGLPCPVPAGTTLLYTFMSLQR
jgi:hypothetical protein